MDDPEVVAAIAAGELDGLAAALDKYAASLYEYCYSMAPEVAADAVQDTFIIAWSKLGGLRDPGKLHPWLQAVAGNECFRRTLAGSVTGVHADVPPEATPPPKTTLPPGLPGQILSACADNTPAGRAHRTSVTHRAGPFGYDGFPKANALRGTRRRVRRHRRAGAAVAAAAVLAAAAIMIVAISPASSSHHHQASAARPGGRPGRRVDGVRRGPADDAGPADPVVERGDVTGHGGAFGDGGGREASGRACRVATGGPDGDGVAGSPAVTVTVAVACRRHHRLRRPDPDPDPDPDTDAATTLSPPVVKANP